MPEMPELLLRVTKALGAHGEEIGMMTIVVRRPYAPLEEELRAAFAGQENVQVVVDQRNGDRREAARHVADDRRRQGRRVRKEEMVELALSF